MNDINNQQKSLSDCQSQAPNSVTNLDPAPPFCGRDDNDPNLRGVNSGDLNWLVEDDRANKGLGARVDCDPMTRGLLRNDQNDTNPDTLYRYSKGLRGCDEALLDLFSNIIVIDNDGKAHGIPIIWATQERAVAAILMDNVRKDDSLVVDRIRLPMLAISSTDFQFDPNRYTYHMALDYMRSLRQDQKPGFTLNEKGKERSTIFGKARGYPVNVTYTMYAWTLYIEDMNQIVEQVMLKIQHCAYIRVRGVSWEVAIKLDSVASNVETEPGDATNRVIKYQFNITAETYIPQPIARRKAILKTKVELVDGIQEDEVTEVIGRLEEIVKELDC